MLGDAQEGAEAARWDREATSDGAQCRQRSARVRVRSRRSADTARRDDAERCVNGVLMFRAAFLAVGGGGGGDRDGLGFVTVEENVALLLGGLASTIVRQLQITQSSKQK